MSSIHLQLLRCSCRWRKSYWGMKWFYHLAKWTEQKKISGNKGLERMLLSLIDTNNETEDKLQIYCLLDTSECCGHRATKPWNLLIGACREAKMVWKSRGSYREARAGAFLETGIASRINKEIADPWGGGRGWPRRVISIGRSPWL